MTLDRLQKLVLAALFCAAFLLSTGCQSGGFKPNLGALKPDFGKLAFWKKDNVQLASRNVPPPSAHFNPEREESPKSIAEAKQQHLKDSVDAIIAEAKRNKTIPKDPTRQPYSLDSVESKIGSAKASNNDFAGSSQFQDLKRSATTAIESSQDTLRQAGQIAKNPGKAISGLTNNIQQASQHAASQIASGVSDGVARQANNIVSNAVGAANNLIDSASNGVRQTVNEVQENVDNSFRPRGTDNNSRVTRNPYLGALNDTGKEFVNAASATGNAAVKNLNAAVGNAQNAVSQAVNNVAVSSAVARKTGNAAESAAMGQTSIQQSSFSSSEQKKGAALQPLNKNNEMANSKAGSSATGYPSTPYGMIQPVSATKPSSVPAELLNANSHFSPGSTKPLRPLR